MSAIELKVESTTLEVLVQMAQEGFAVVLTKSGHPVAQVIPIPRLQGNRTSPLHPGTWEVAKDFDEPLPSGFWLGEK